LVKIIEISFCTGTHNEKKTDIERGCFADDTAPVIRLLDFGGCRCRRLWGYKMKENGYTLQNPITKERSKKSSQ